MRPRGGLGVLIPDRSDMQTGFHKHAAVTAAPCPTSTQSAATHETRPPPRTWEHTPRPPSSQRDLPTSGRRSDTKCFLL